MVDALKLQSALGIEAADLELNRQGKLSSRQADHIGSFVKWRKTTVFIAIGAAFVLALVGAVAAHAPLAEMIGGAIPGLLVAWLIVTVLNKFLFTPLLEQAGGSVRSVEGTIERRYVAYSGRGYAIWIKGLRYGGTKTSVGRLLHEGDRVRIFVTSGGLIVGAEPA